MGEPLVHSLCGSGGELKGWVSRCAIRLAKSPITLITCVALMNPVIVYSSLCGAGAARSAETQQLVSLGVD